MPFRAAFQYGVKMNDGRKTRRQGVKNEKAKINREWQQISQVRGRGREGGRRVGSREGGNVSDIGVILIGQRLIENGSQVKGKFEGGMKTEGGRERGNDRCHIDCYFKYRSFKKEKLKKLMCKSLDSHMTKINCLS